MKMEGIRQIVDREIAKVREYIPQSSSLWDIVTNIGQAVKREGKDYQQRTWLYRANDISEKVDTIDKVAISENIDPIAIKNLRSLLETTMEYTRKKEVANMDDKDGKAGVLSKFEQSIQKLDNLYSRLSVPSDVPISLVTGRSDEITVHNAALQGTINALEQTTIAATFPNTGYKIPEDQYTPPAQKQASKSSWSLSGLLKNPYSKNPQTGKRSWIKATAAAASGLAAGIYIMAQIFPGNYIGKAEQAAKYAGNAAQSAAYHFMDIRDRATSAFATQIRSTAPSPLESLTGPMQPFIVKGKQMQFSPYNLPSFRHVIRN